MHSLAVQLAPVIAAEKSKVPFYICGGLLVLWALIVSLALGLRKPLFPGSEGGQRAVIGITAVLVVAAITSAVLTSGGERPHSSTNIYTTGEAPPPTPGGAYTPAAATSSESATATSPSSEPSTSSSTSTSTAKEATKAPPARVGTTLALSANQAGQLSYNTKTLSAKAGNVTITMTNMSPVEHNVTIAEGAKVLGATPTFSGGARTVSLLLKPGTYTFYCSVPGHRQAGMEGTLKVS
jgi:plastocyanin